MVSLRSLIHCPYYIIHQSAPRLHPYAHSLIFLHQPVNGPKDAWVLNRNGGNGLFMNLYIYINTTHEIIQYITHSNPAIVPFFKPYVNHEQLEELHSKSHSTIIFPWYSHMKTMIFFPPEFPPFVLWGTQRPGQPCGERGPRRGESLWLFLSQIGGISGESFTKDGGKA